MRRSLRRVRPAIAGFLGALAVIFTFQAHGMEVVLKDGRILRGRVGETASLAEQGGAGEGDALKQIVFVNDDFRLIYVSRRQVQAVRPDTSLDDAEKFECEQPRSNIGKNRKMLVSSVGPPAGPMKDWDDWGRRTYPMRTASGILNVVQVITEITPQYARAEALRQTWDMRIATSTLSDEKLEKILMHQINPKNLEHRKKVVRFFLQCKRYGKAVELLQKTIDDFGSKTEVVQQLQPTLDKLHIMYAQQMLEELGLRREGGQHALVLKYLEKFPSEHATGEILQTVRQVKQQYQDIDKQRKTIINDLGALMPLVASTSDRAELAPAISAIDIALSAETLPRMAAFLQNQNDSSLKPEEKLSLAVAGWLLGADAATPNLAMTLSAWRVHRPVREYMSEPLKIKRDRILEGIRKEPAARPEIIAALASHMTPPYPLPDPIDEKLPGYFKQEVGVIPGQPSVEYYVQLPPEYDPLRRYPMIVSLHALGMDPELQINWWAGDPQPDTAGNMVRQGQAGRYGYIVLAPAWTVEHQKQYEYSAREHAAVLGCVRDACRRFAVDSDRIFLSGHSTGGDAAWDIGVSHPDVWAGVIPIAAEAKNACNFYTENARQLPFYLVIGELDGGRITRDAMVLDRYLKNGFNATVVEYLGRGHEHFVDEQLALFDWMGRCKRSFPMPREREFSCATVRPTDNAFWWAQIESLPQNSIVNSWPAPHGVKPLLLHGNVPLNSNSVVLTAGNSPVTIWLSPEMVNFNARINISVGGRRPSGVPGLIKPSIETMLEDLRLRGDRQHPFWAKVEAK